MNIEHVRVVDLTEARLARCRELSYGDEGYMCEDLDNILEEERCWRYRYSQAILLGEAKMDGTVGNIYGWSLLQPVYRSRRYSAQFFVDPSHRGQGHGARLLAEANRWCKNPLCFVDTDNQGFFERFPSMYERYEEKVK